MDTHANTPGQNLGDLDRRERDRLLQSCLGMKVRDIARLLREDGSYRARTSGSQRHYQHKFKPGTVTLAGRDGDDVPVGPLRTVFRQAGRDWRQR